MQVLMNIQAAFASTDVRTAEDALVALCTSKPLADCLETMPHEWAREALDQGWLFSVFHPIVHAMTGEVFGYESLIRANNPSNGQMYGAGQIIQSCELLKLHHRLDQQARRTAIAAASRLDVAKSARFFINFMPNTIYNPEICLRTTMEAADEYGVPLSQLVFEVVETEKITDMKRLKNILTYYQERGAKVAVDDMGAGFTCVEYLTALEPDFVKIDRDVVVKAAVSPEHRTSFERVVALAHRLEIAVIAEGIETRQQMQICQDAGVQYLQGFLFARPANPPEKVAVERFTDFRIAA